ncbi:MAG: phosphoribosylformylglycinamidine synthase [Spirochaetae bacterium HGW-Spirochaetae-9]|nr:MAG: phosphoribosylformylglycinamidine synthase [Spirochaetae bacterium HGW-Spirochaetae-9]
MMFAQANSEHCRHKIFNAQFTIDGVAQDKSLFGMIRHTHQTAPQHTIVAYSDNASIMEGSAVERFVARAGIGPSPAYASRAATNHVLMKVETHNHPSAIEPFGGANTGVGGVIRDVVAVSARPIAVTDVLCFGLIGEGGADAPGAGLSVEHIRSGVVAGVQDYGNKMGIPTVNGGIHYHAKYAANPLVYCGCAGIAPKGAFFSRPCIGDRIVVLGGRTGRDGIRGATFSSMTMDGATFDTAGSSVQIGAPIVEKKVTEAILAARDAGIYSGITDCGAGGLSSAVGEMASDLGGSVDLSEVRLKYSGLAPWEIWLSEAQERMVIAVPPKNMSALAAICDGNDVEFCDLGFFTGDGRLVVRYRDEKILDLSCDFLHHGMPQRLLRAAAPHVAFDGKFVASGHAALPTSIPPLEKLYCAVMSHHAIASKEWAIRRYDHEVQGATKIGPFAGSLQSGPSDAAVIKPLETKGRRGIAISNGFNPRYGEADSYNAAASAIDEAVRNAVASGADPDRIAIVDNFCWGDPQKPENLWTLLRAAQACKDASLAHRAPFFCGKDSFNNEFEGVDGERIAIPPSLLISAMGIVPDIACAPTTDLKSSTGILYLVGEFSPVFSASIAQDILSGPANSGTYNGSGPAFSHSAPAVYRGLHASMRDSLVLSCHDLSDGGLGTALAEMCLGGGLGADIDLRCLEQALYPLAANGEILPRQQYGQGLDVLILFGETNGCLLVEVAPGKAEKFEAFMAGLPCRKIGHCATESRIEVKLTGSGSLSAGLSELEIAYMAESAIALGDLAEDGDESGDIL